MPDVINQCCAYLHQFIFGVGENAKVFVQLFDTVGTHREIYTQLDTIVNVKHT